MKLPEGKKVSTDDLRELSKEQLIVLVLRLHGRIVDLEQRINRTEKNSKNSSVPPSKDENRKRGKKKRKYFGRDKSGKTSGGQPCGKHS